MNVSTRGFVSATAIVIAFGGLSSATADDVDTPAVRVVASARNYGELTICG